MDPRPDRLDAAFVHAAGVSLDLLRHPEVAQRWSEPSALPRMSVGALACHLGRQTVRVAELLPTATDVAPLDSADAHYRSATWVTSTSPDDPANDRSHDDADAGLGVDALVRRTAHALDAARELLGSDQAQKVVLIPWQGWSLSRDDFLLTRLVEIVVHTDDLAASIGTPTPDFPEGAFTPVLELLARLAAHRHGQSAAISALSRDERSRSISAF